MNSCESTQTQPVRVTTGQLLARTRVLLGEIPGLWGLVAGLGTSGRAGGSGDGSKRLPPGSRPPIDVHLLDLIEGCDLFNWVHLAIDEMVYQDVEPADPPDPKNPSVEACCSWLAANAAWILDNNPDFPAAISKLYWQYRYAADLPPETTYTCDQCGWQVEPRDQNAWFACTGCNRTWALANEIDRLMRDQASVMTLGKVADKVGVPHPTLRRWAGEGRFQPVGHRSGRPLYDVRHVEKAMQRTSAA